MELKLINKFNVNYTNRQATRILMLKNMTTIESVDEGLKNEVAEECDKYGKVLVLIYNRL